MNANGTRLTALTRELWAQWQQTRQAWDDVKSREFEQRFLLELLSTVDKTVVVIEELDKLVTKIKSDCE
jgi:hypothetical protein